MDAKPSSKTTTTAVAGAIVTILVWVAAEYGIEVPGPVAAAVSTLIATAIAYFMVAKSGKYVILPEERDGEGLGDEPEH